MTPEYPEAFNFKSILYTLNIREAQMSLCFILAILKYKVENWKAPKDPRMTLMANFTPFHSTVARFPDN